MKDRSVLDVLDQLMTNYERLAYDGIKSSPEGQEEPGQMPQRQPSNEGLRPREAQVLAELEAVKKRLWVQAKIAQTNYDRLKLGECVRCGEEAAGVRTREVDGEEVEVMVEKARYCRRCEELMRR